MDQSEVVVAYIEGSSAVWARILQEFYALTISIDENWFSFLYKTPKGLIIFWTKDITPDHDV